MSKISRKEFLKTSGLVLAAPFVPVNVFSRSGQQQASTDDALLARMVEANDKSIASLLEMINQPQQRQYYRNLSGGFANLTAGYCNSKSSYYKSKEIVPALETMIRKLLELQYPNGTLDSGGNRLSPPDTAFLLEALCPAAKILNQHEFAELSNAKRELEKFLRNAGEGLRTGGVHTPNHRWVVCSVLAQLYAIFKDKAYLDRIEQWLAEGIYINEDGQFPERSRNYARVEDLAFIHLAEILDRPALFDYVRKSLSSTFYYMEPDGELVCLDSRRQDQYRPVSIALFYIHYRYMAIHDNNGFFAAITRKIESLDNFDRYVLSRALALFMESPVLSKKLPESNELPDQYTKYIVQSDLVRLKRGKVTASIFGGTDKPLIVASGRSTNPSFFTFRKGAAVLEYARLSSNFFNMGYFRSDGLRKDGNTYTLSETKEAYYYHPLPANKQNEAGDYKLSESVDGRFWSKMDFGSRPKDTLDLVTLIKIVEDNGVFQMDFDITGAENVEVTLELCFREGGVLQGVTQGRNDDEYFLESGQAKYISGSDSIEIGPGKFAHDNVSRMDGEVYSTHFGSIKGKGMHLYITGLVPFVHSITIK